MTQTYMQHSFRHKLHRQLIKLYHFLGIPLHKNYFGPKIFTQYQKLSLIILFRRSKKSLRDFVTELLESKWPTWLGLKALPSKSALHSWLEEFPVTFIRKVNSLLLLDETPELMAIDASGIDSWHRSRHYEKRIGAPNMPYSKLDIMIVTEKMLIYDHNLRMKPRHDTIGATSIFRRTRLKGVTILGDGGYDSEPLHKEVRLKGNWLFAPVRKGRKTPKGWNRKRCKKGDERYHRRSTVESAFHSLKRRVVPMLRSKKSHMKKKEMAWYVIVYNMDKLGKQIKAILKYIFLHYSGQAPLLCSLNSFPSIYIFFFLEFKIKK